MSLTQTQIDELDALEPQEKFDIFDAFRADTSNAELREKFLHLRIRNTKLYIDYLRERNKNRVKN